MSNKELEEALVGILDRQAVSVTEEDLHSHSSDETEDLCFEPDVVVWPENTEQVSAVLRFCNENEVIVTPRGAGTGLSGGALPVKGGVSLDMSRMNRIIDIDALNFQVTVEPGVINDDLRTAVAEKGLFYPPDPASKGSCFIGGNLAHNSGGPKAVKYGVTRDYVLNLELVLPNGDVIWTGSDTLKNSTGYSLTQLIVGSEGTLGVITKAVLKLIALPEHQRLLLCSFENAAMACSAVPKIMASGVVPSSMEFMERKGVDMAMDQLGYRLDIPDEAEAVLLVEVDGFDSEKLLEDIELIYKILEDHKVLDVGFAESSEQMERIWKVRRSISEAVKRSSVYKEEDTVVKRGYLPELFQGVKRIGEKYGFTSVCYGHVGDGNLHVNILKADMSDEQWNGDHLENGIREIFRLCKELGGTISGEHGIGYVQKKYMNEVMGQTHFNLMRGIKHTFDPKGILNPGKIFD